MPIAAAALLSGCALGWDEVDDCGEDGVCEPCTSDTECTVGYTCCGETMFCFHKEEDTLPVCSLGCITPDPPPCRCEAGRCRFQSPPRSARTARAASGS